MIDVHSHLDEARFNEDLEEVVARANEKNVVIVNSGTNPIENKKALETAKKYGLKVSFGLYPIDVIAKDFPEVSDDSYREIPQFDLDEALSWIKENKDDCIAIGEIGLDFKAYPVTEEMKAKQIEYFEKIIEFAKSIDKPILIHSRGAEKECIDIMEKHECKKVIMHCFSGNKKLIQRCINNGWMLSVPPIITRLLHFQMLSEMVPLEQLLTETDSPYLSPVAGERNEPANVEITIKKIAEIKSLSESEVRNQIWDNAVKIFGF